MKKSSKQRGRSHGRSNNNFNKNNLNNCFDSNGPGGRIRGTVQQIIEKYLLLARDANAQNDRILAENYYQYAEHYNRIINNILPPPVIKPDEATELQELKIENQLETVKVEAENNNKIIKDEPIAVEAPSITKKPRKKKEHTAQLKETSKNMIQEVGFLTKPIPVIVE